MKTYQVHYTTFSRGLTGTIDVEAEDLQAALRALARSSGHRRAEKAMLDGKAIWHARLGDIRRHPGNHYLRMRGLDHLPCWGLNELLAFLKADAGRGVFAQGNLAAATISASSGQSQDLKGICRFKDIFALVKSGQLRVVPVLFQSYWMYEQPEAGAFDKPDRRVLFQDHIPTIARLL